MSQMTAKPFFSIVIPAYNAEKTIARTLQSLAKQTFSDFEAVLVLDGCKDRTLQTIEEQMAQFKDGQIVVIQNATNFGPSRGRNQGWNKATGRYVLFLDADDEFLPEKLKTVHESLHKMNFPAVIGHNADLPDVQTSQSGELHRLSFFNFLSRNRIFTPCLGVRNDLPERFDETMRYCEDYDLLLRLSYKYEVFFLEKSLTYIHRPPLSKGGWSENHLGMRKGEIKAFTKLPQLNPVFWLLSPFLMVYSLLKYLRFLVRKSI